MKGLKSALQDFLNDLIIPAVIFTAIFLIGVMLWVFKVQFLIDFFDSLKQFLLAWILFDLVITITVYNIVLYGAGIILLVSKLFRKK